MRNKAGKFATALAIVLSVFSGVPLLSDGMLIVSAASAQDDWKKEFEDICSKTQDSMSIHAG